MSRYTRRGRASARNGPLLGIAEISYLATIDKISRPDAERELRRTMTATWPAELPTKKRDDLIAIILGYPVVEWVQCMLEIAAWLGAPTRLAVALPDGRTIRYVANVGAKS